MTSLCDRTFPWIMLRWAYYVTLTSYLTFPNLHIFECALNPGGGGSPGREIQNPQAVPTWLTEKKEKKDSKKECKKVIVGRVMVCHSRGRRPGDEGRVGWRVVHLSSKAIGNRELCLSMTLASPLWMPVLSGRLCWYNHITGNVRLTRAAMSRTKRSSWCEISRPLLPA